LRCRAVSSLKTINAFGRSSETVPNFGCRFFRNLLDLAGFGQERS